jgi:exodeoxyribonuclease VII small subunit
MSQTDFPDIAGMPFEAAMQALDALLAQMEGGRLELEASLAAYARGAALLAHCRGLLADAEQKIEALEAGLAGEAGDAA